MWRRGGGQPRLLTAANLESMSTSASNPAEDSPLLLPVAGRTFVGELEIKRSRFITWIRRVRSEDEARALIAQAREEFPDARHHCSAYLYEVEGSNRVERSSDDGEPSGTAGRPMLDVLAGSGLTDIGAVVVRYFGGVKLGTGGLVSAYSDAVRQVLIDVDTVRKSPRALRSVEVRHADAGRIEAELRARDVTVVDVAYRSKAVLTLAVPATEEAVAELDALLQALSHGALTTSAAGHTWLEW